MKILYINSNRFDYLQDVVYSGLIKILGVNNVFPTSFNRSYYFNIRKYPKNLGYHKGDFYGYIKNRFSNFKYDCVIVSSAKKLPFEIYLKIVHRIPDSCPIIFLDGGDVSEIGGDLNRLGCQELYKKAIQQRPFDIIFKREMLKNIDYPSNVYPCPFAFNMDRIKNVTDKKYDVSFWAGMSHESRKEVFSLLKGKYDCDKNGTSDNNSLNTYKRKGDFYFEELKRCKIVLNLRGGGWDTLRFWEVLAVKSFMISQKLDIIIPNDFTDGENIVYFDNDFSNFYEKIDYYLGNENIREKIAVAGYEHLCKYHTDIARVNYIIKLIREML